MTRKVGHHCIDKRDPSYFECIDTQKYIGSKVDRTWELIVAELGFEECGTSLAKKILGLPFPPSFCVAGSRDWYCIPLRFIDWPVEAKKRNASDSSAARLKR